MPIKIPDALPATAILESENIFVMTEYRALYTGYHPPAVPDSVHFCRASGYFCAVVFLIVYFTLSKHNAVSSVLLSRLARRAKNGRSYFGHCHQKRSLRTACPITIKVQCRPTRGVNIFLDPCCFSLPVRVYKRRFLSAV